MYYQRFQASRTKSASKNSEDTAKPQGNTLCTLSISWHTTYIQPFCVPSRQFYGQAELSKIYVHRIPLPAQRCDYRTIDNKTTRAALGNLKGWYLLIADVPASHIHTAR